MTPEQKSIIQNMRRKLCSYAEIAEILGFPSANTVKSYCYRNHLNTEELLKDAGVCKNCGKPFVKMTKTKPRIFCSDACKLAWWKNHVNEHKRTCKTKYVCQTCGTSFTDYPSSERKKNAAAYARVSSGSDEQFTSYEAQINYYTKFINRREDWLFVKVYTDEGISGTNTKNRNGFNEMIQDASDGKIDLIVTKSVSRFARNTAFGYGKHFFVVKHWENLLKFSRRTENQLIQWAHRYGHNQNAEVFRLAETSSIHITVPPFYDIVCLCISCEKTGLVCISVS